jgi:hypothetical protein
MNLALQVGRVSEYGHESRGTRTRERLRWGCPATTESTDLISRQRGRPTSTNPQLSKDDYEKKKNWSLVPDGCLTPSQTGRLSVGRNIILTFITRVFL